MTLLAAAAAHSLSTSFELRWAHRSPVAVRIAPHAACASR
jgi:hypothetical protein